MNHYTFDDLNVGKRNSIEITIREEDILAFAKLSGDMSPIHLDDNFARSKGFKSRIAHGALLASYVSRFIGVYLPGANGLLQMIEMQFHRPCYPDTTIRIEGEVVRQIESVRVIRLKITLTDAGNEVVLASGTVQSGILDISIESRSESKGDLS